MSEVYARAFPEQQVRARARIGPAAIFPAEETYGLELFGADDTRRGCGDAIDLARLVPPVFMPGRLQKLLELGREPTFADVELSTELGGFRSSLPVFLSAFGSTQLGGANLSVAVSGQAGRLGIPMVIGENVVPVNGYGRDAAHDKALLNRVRAYVDGAPDDMGGVVIQQSTEDADAEVWNLVYSDPTTESLLASGRLGFELKVGQGAKPGLGGMTVLSAERAAKLGGQYVISSIFGPESPRRLRSSSPGTFTDEILRQQVRLMRNNFPRARIWVKLHPARDAHLAAAAAWSAGADAVTIDGAEGGTGWAPIAFLDHVGLPLGHCLLRIGRPGGCLLATGRMWEGCRAVKCLAMGARAVGLGRAALIAADEDPEHGLIRLTDSLALEMRMLISALGRYASDQVDFDDVWIPAS
jgi:hypothetical protein